MKNKKRYAKCICSYIEDCNEYWTRGKIYKFHKQKDNYKIKTNFDKWGFIGKDYICDNFDEYFKIIWL